MIQCTLSTGPDLSHIQHLLDEPDRQLSGELRFFVSFRIFFSDITRVRILFFCCAKVRLYDKNSELDYFILPPPKSEYFFQQHWVSVYIFLEKKP